MNKYPFTVDSKIYKDPQSSNSDGSSQRIIKVVITLDDQTSNKNNSNNEQHNFHANLNHHEDNSSTINPPRPLLTISSSYVRESPPHNYPKKNYTIQKKPKLVEQITQYEEKIEAEDSESNETQSPRRLGPPSFNSPSYKKSFNIDKSTENQDYNSNSDNFPDLSPKATKIDQRKKKANIFSRTLRTSNENSQISSIKPEIPENFVQIKREEKKKFNYTQQINSQKSIQNSYKKQNQSHNQKRVFNQKPNQLLEEDSDDIINEPPKVPIIFRSHKTRKSPMKEKPYFSTSTIPIDNERTEKTKKNEKRINRKILRIPTVNDDLPIFHQDPPKVVNTQKVINHDEHPVLIEEEEEIQDENEEEKISFASSTNNQNHDNIRRKIDFTDSLNLNQREEHKLTNINSSDLNQRDDRLTNMNYNDLNRREEQKLTNINSSGLNQRDDRLTNINYSDLNRREEQKLTNLNSSGLNQKVDNKLMNSNAGGLNQNMEFDKLDFDDSDEEEDLLVSDQEDDNLNENENFTQNKDEIYNNNNVIQGKTTNKLTIEPIEINAIFDKSYQQKNRFSKIENQLIFDEDPDEEFDPNKVDNDHSDIIKPVNSTIKPTKFTFHNQTSLNINYENEERLLNNPPAKEKVINVIFDNLLSDENKNNFENSQELNDQTQTVISSPIKSGVSINYSPIKKMENDEIENNENNKVSSLITKENDDKKDDNFWMFIPVDKKKHKKEINITQNMSKVVNVSRNYVKGVQAFRSLSMLLNQHRYEHFIMNLDKENQKLIGIFTLNDRMNQIKKIWGDGPEKATLDDVNSSLLYNPSSKKFSNLDPSFTQDVDAVYLK